MMRTTQVPLTGVYQNLADLIAAKMVTLSKGNWPSFGQFLELISEKSNAGGTRVQITSDPTGTPDPAYELLTEQTQPFINTGGSRRNSISTLDKYARIVDAAGVATTGLLTVVLDTA